MARKRPYSTEFTARTDKPHRYLLDGIPPTLWEKAQQKARREGRSMRTTILILLSEWLGEGPGAPLKTARAERDLQAILLTARQALDEATVQLGQLRARHANVGDDG